jgi:heterodisulfide reductase subunit A
MVWAKMVQQAAHRLPEAAIGAFYFRTGLPEQEAPGLFRDLAREGRLELVPMKSRDSFRIETAGGGIGMDCIDARGVRRTSSWDLMVLAQGAAPGRDASRLADILDVKLSAGGFFTGGGSLLEPVGTERDGVFAAGCAGGPKDVRSSILEGQAAAGAVLSRLRPGETLTLEPVAARIDEELCCGCRLCSGLCPFKAVTWREGQGKPEVNRLLCRGCGSCAAACPSGAIDVEHFTFLQISKEIEALVK